MRGLISRNGRSVRRGTKRAMALRTRQLVRGSKDQGLQRKCTGAQTARPKTPGRRHPGRLFARSRQPTGVRVGLRVPRRRCPSTCLRHGLSSRHHISSRRRLSGVRSRSKRRHQPSSVHSSLGPEPSRHLPYPYGILRRRHNQNNRCSGDWVLARRPRILNGVHPVERVPG